MPLGFKEGKVFFPQVVERRPFHSIGILSVDTIKIFPNSIAQNLSDVKNFAGCSPKRRTEGGDRPWREGTS